MNEVENALDYTETYLVIHEYHIGRKLQLLIFSGYMSCARLVELRKTVYLLYHVLKAMTKFFQSLCICTGQL